MKVEIDSDTLLKLDDSLKRALKFIRELEETDNLYFVLNKTDSADTVKDDLSDAICRISERVYTIKQG